MSNHCDIGQTTLVDWLYGELEASDSERFEQHMEDCAICAKEASAASATREAARSLAPVEPPPAMAQLLLREAAKRAPSADKAENPGFFARLASFFGPVLTHPAMATAACVVLVAGVTGVLYLRNGSDLVATPEPAGRQTVTLESEPAEPAAAPAEQGFERNTALEGYAADLADKSDREAVRKAEKSAAAEEIDSVQVDRNAESKRRSRARKSERRARPRPDRAVESKPNGRTKKQAPTAAVGSALSTGTLGSDLARGAAAGGDQRYASPPPPEPTAPERRNISMDRDEAPAAPAPTASPEPEAEPPRLTDGERKWANEILNRLRAAAKKRRCDSAARLANDLRDRVPTFYAQNAAGTEAVRSCKKQVATERQRRVRAQRQRQKAGTDKSAD